MTKSLHLHRAVAICVAASLAGVMATTLPPQLSGGASAFQGQDIMGGAAIVFKRPQRVRDILGGAAMFAEGCRDL